MDLGSGDSFFSGVNLDNSVIDYDGWGIGDLDKYLVGGQVDGEIEGKAANVHIEGDGINVEEWMLEGELEEDGIAVEEWMLMGELEEEVSGKVQRKG